MRRRHMARLCVFAGWACLAATLRDEASRDIHQNQTTRRLRWLSLSAGIAGDFGSSADGGRDRDRTCDPYHVKVRVANFSDLFPRSDWIFNFRKNVQYHPDNVSVSLMGFPDVFWH